MDKKRTASILLLVLVSLIWGSAFVAQSVGAELVPPFAFNATRSIIAGVALLPVIAIVSAKNKRAGVAPMESAPGGRKLLIVGGIVCGLILAIASALQQIGIKTTTTGKAGFITALYIVIVPILGIFLKKKPHFTVWISVAIAVTGMYLLCMTSERLTLKTGDIYVLLCALVYSFHILALDYFSDKVDCLKMSALQFLTCGVVSAIASLFTETVEIKNVFAAWLPILYTGILSSGVGYTLQMIAQKNCPPAIASLTMSLESVFSVLAGWALLGQVLSARELAGCALMFVAIMFAQTPDILSAIGEARARKKASANGQTK